MSEALKSNWERSLALSGCRLRAQGKIRTNKYSAYTFLNNLSLGEKLISRVRKDLVSRSRRIEKAEAT